jgi:hypothetical protein
LRYRVAVRCQVDNWKIIKKFTAIKGGIKDE